MTIKQSVINTFDRVGIYPDVQSLINKTDKVTAYNRFGFGECQTTPLIKYLIEWVYQISNAYENGKHDVNVSDFDRVRYFVLEQDSNAYNTCLD